MSAARPDFVIIGAQKSGSTALMTQLARHPEIHLPAEETRYFRDPWFRFEDERVLETAVAGAGPGVRRRGIKCPDYLAAPLAAERIHDALGAVSLLCVLREPVARAVSAWHWGVQWGWLPLLPAERGLAMILDGELQQTHPRAAEVLEYGRYAHHLTRYRELFGADRLHVLLDTDLRDMGAALQGVHAFLGVEVRPPVEVPVVNEGVYSPARLRFLARRHRHILRTFEGHEDAGRFLQPARGVRGTVVNRAVSGVDRLLLARVLPNAKPVLSPALHRRLADYYADDVAALEPLIGRDLTAWRTPPTTHTPKNPTARRAAVRRSYYPETALDGFSRIDSAVEFYLRIDALLPPDATVLDFGAGRGQWFHDTESRTRHRLRDFRGRAARVIGADVDAAVHDNPSLDEAYVIPASGRLPLPDASIDLVVSDFTFEHVTDPAGVVAELDRVLKPGGWICARTPNRWGYIGVAARAVPNRWHIGWLRSLQPHRRAEDVFPVRYRLNTPAAVRAHFPAPAFETVSYAVGGEPNYAGASLTGWRVLGGVTRLLPRAAQPMLLIFVRKRATPSGG